MHRSRRQIAKLHPEESQLLATRGHDAPPYPSDGLYYFTNAFPNYKRASLLMVAYEQLF
jgi:hypothetical protein